MTAFAYSHSDRDLVDQPVGYWSSAAGAAVVHHIRTMLAEMGLTQPQWWILNQLLQAPEGRPRDEVVAVLKGYLEVGEGALVHNIEALRDRGLVSEVPGTGRITLTDEGRALRARVAERQKAVRAQIHKGITDEDYVRTLKVLQRMIHNVGGSAWHH
ncbi:MULTISPECIES: MarR family winged helix-turn-helix transcriptional regulator [unclassified Streptomyces]|uniref:MarR family winged helix-turn-helix transcriptional regulator n=1 Tax=unclassified Streptomyces TaxID=2593676 RepID=UPI00136F457C|nr:MULTISPECIES: MarR family winged helix-turn-helix transcriptional regulator [unclassified Streptomyces]NDZ98816.1 winged helix-turn-helix transcriptional regulator [Streptomyces sp. SID10116]MYY84491.1 winged helix DNA-binding protein [Streptomyces sp. SID335]MYZ15383.1 winged helix DNA-binding protein [Streptomyces sp. SID337]NDZ91201.1 winged helix-turn-helix transcriptional regulator [Streptomyces sp. SID10115]NEB50327.1 winged helix-turn-helix transcriptional regulator [Streptomyces sp.